MGQGRRRDRSWTVRPKIDLTLTDVTTRCRAQGAHGEEGRREAAQKGWGRTQSRKGASRVLLVCTSVFLLSSPPVTAACKPAFHDHGAAVLPLAVPSASPPYSAFTPQLHPSASYPSMGKSSEDALAHHKQKLNTEHAVNVMLGEFVGEDVQVGGGEKMGENEKDNFVDDMKMKKMEKKLAASKSSKASGNPQAAPKVCGVSGVVEEH
eukprot:756214-Hanusia_phi.AAC.3